MNAEIWLMIATWIFVILSVIFNISTIRRLRRSERRNAEVESQRHTGQGWR